MTPPPIVELAADAEASAWPATRFIAARASSAFERFGLLSGGSTPNHVSPSSVVVQFGRWRHHQALGNV